MRRTCALEKGGDGGAELTRFGGPDDKLGGRAPRQWWREAWAASSARWWRAQLWPEVGEEAARDRRWGIGGGALLEETAPLRPGRASRCLVGEQESRGVEKSNPFSKCFFFFFSFVYLGETDGSSNPW